MGICFGFIVLVALMVPTFAGFSLSSFRRNYPDAPTRPSAFNSRNNVCEDVATESNTIDFAGIVKYPYIKTQSSKSNTFSSVLLLLHQFQSSLLF